MTREDLTLMVKAFFCLSNGIGLKVGMDKSKGLLELKEPTFYIRISLKLIQAPLKPI